MASEVPDISYVDLLEGFWRVIMNNRISLSVNQAASMISMICNIPAADVVADLVENSEIRVQAGLSGICNE